VINVIGGGINLGDHNRVGIGKMLSQFVPDRSKRLAVSTPRGIELEKDVLGFVQNNLIEILSNDHFDGSIVVFRDILRLKRWFEFTTVESGNMGTNVVSSQSSVETELLHVSFTH